MKPRALWFFYRKRLRTQLGQELLALFGIAVGVALVFAVLTANQSISGSVDDLARGLVGRASLELHARDSRGFDEALYERVRRIPDVRRAAPVLEQRVVVVGPDDRRSVALLGGDTRLQRLGGKLLGRVGPLGGGSLSAVSVPDSVAQPLGLYEGQSVTLLVGERRITARVGAVLGQRAIGSLADVPIVGAPLAYAQRLAGLRGRVTRILVEPRPGRAAEAKRALERVAAGRLDVRRSDAEATLIREAAKPNDQSSLVFSVISAGIGLLFAYNAMLLTLPTRRHLCADLRLVGYNRRQILTSLLFETAMLAVVGIGLGLVLGDLLSRMLFGEIPQYLTSAFFIGTQRIVTPGTIAAACAAGLVATFAAAARPLRELYSTMPADATYRLTLTQGERVSGRPPHGLFWAGLGLLAALTAFALVLPTASLVAAVACALVSVAVLPLILSLVGRGGDPATGRGHRRAMVRFAIRELSATRTRSAALAATAAMAVFGITVIEGSRQDLVRGLDAYAADLTSTADVYVRPGGRENFLSTQPFPAEEPARRLEAIPSVRAVRRYGGSLLDFGDRRVVVLAPPPQDQTTFLRSQLQEGELAKAASQINRGGWAAVSSKVAQERGLEVGDVLRLPTPSGVAALRVAAITASYGWSSGAVVLGARDYARLWGAESASQLAVEARPGIPPGVLKREIAAALGPRSGLRVLTAGEQKAELGAVARQGLEKLGQIRTLVLICAAFAVAAMMTGAVWQRRQRLAALKTIGLYRGQLWRLILVEAVVLLTLGGSVGAGLGLYAQAVATRWLELVPGYTVIYSPALGLAGATLAVFIVLATAMIALPGRLAAGVHPRVAFSE